MLSRQRAIVPAIAHVLAWSQKYMRERKVTGSVEVAAVCVYFTYSRMNAVLSV